MGHLLVKGVLKNSLIRKIIIFKLGS